MDREEYSFQCFCWFIFSNKNFGLPRVFVSCEGDESTHEMKAVYFKGLLDRKQESCFDSIFSSETQKNF